MVTGSSMASADISTPLNRASTAAPLGAAFNGGTIMGPALGGCLAAALGPSATFLAVGGLIMGDAVFAATKIEATSVERDWFDFTSIRGLSKGFGDGACLTFRCTTT